MKNADMPAMPTIYADMGHNGEREIYCDQIGLTKRETFAMNAPNCPTWYSAKFIADNCRNNDLVDGGYNLTFKGEMQLFRQWRYEYAEIMLGEL